MGYNTTVVILNDALGTIEKDPKFGQRLAEAIQNFGMRDRNEFSAHVGGGGCSAGSVIAQHHASDTSVVAVGGNHGTLLLMAGGTYHTREGQEALLEHLADKFGYTLQKKRAPRKRSVPNKGA